MHADTYERALIIKLFIFQFANNYTSFFYIVPSASSNPRKSTAFGPTELAAFTSPRADRLCKLVNPYARTAR